jgi:two-component system chemotaxis response regulator CheB
MPRMDGFVIEKPSGGRPEDFTLLRDRLTSTVKLMAEVKVVRRRPARLTGALELPARGRSHASPAVVVIGASTGGPAALNTVLRQLPADFRVPVVVVQHMATGFTQGLVEWLQLDSRLPLRLARHGERLMSGEVYFAGEGQHLVFLERGVLGGDSSPAISHVRPSATVLFQSAAATYGAEAIGVLLTGMGDDGARGLLAIHDKGGMTLAQDAATSVVYGMPRVAAELGAARYVLALEKIAPTLAQLVR